MLSYFADLDINRLTDVDRSDLVLNTDKLDLRGLRPEYEKIVQETEPEQVGRSKVVWLLPDGECLVGMIPSLSSFTHGRHELMFGTDELRLDFYEQAARGLKSRGIRTAFEERVGPTFYRARYAPSPPIETIVKNYAVGSTVRKYPGLFEAGGPLPRPIVKFDYRCDPEDQPIGEDYLLALDHPVAEWKSLAFATNEALKDWLAPNRLIDFCIIIGTDARENLVINSEISPDCMRLRAPDDAPLDKDLFRSGASRQEILDVWRKLVQSLA